MAFKNKMTVPEMTLEFKVAHPMIAPNRVRVGAFAAAHGYCKKRIMKNCVSTLYYIKT